MAAPIWTNPSNATDPTTIVALDPTLAAVPVPTQLAIIADATAFLDPITWGDQYDRAVMYLAMHMGSMTLRGGGLGSPGAISAQSLGDASTSFAVPVGSPFADLDATTWGRKLKWLWRGRGVFAIVC